VECDVPIDSELFVVTSSISKLTGSVSQTRFSKILIKIRCVFVHRAEPLYLVYMNVYDCTVFRKKITAISHSTTHAHNATYVFN
jgi:hypothetical protein